MNLDFKKLLYEDVVLCPHLKEKDMSRFKTFSRLQSFFTKLWNSYWYFAIIGLMGIVALLADSTVIGVMVLGLVIALNLLFCSDILATTLPFLVLMTLTMANYNHLDVYVDAAWVCPIIIIALIIHLVIYAKPIRLGRSVIGLCLVTLATALGGVGTIACEEYFRPLSLYYTYGLGLGMLLVYVIVRSQSAVEKGPSPLKRLGRVMYVAGLFMAVAILILFWQSDIFADGIGAVPFVSYRNYASTILLMTMTIPCYYVLRSDIHMLSILFMYFVMVLTGSRSGLFFGGVLLAGCMVYLFRYNKRKRRIYMMVTLIAAIPFLISCFVLVEAIFQNRVQGGTLIWWQESRIAFFERAITDFFKNPFFGTGLGYQGNADVFEGVPGSMIFYHNYAAQIIGSMGSLGIFAYAILIYDRMSLITTRLSARTATFVMGYVGILLMSMTNPGEFSPFPYEMLVVIIFALIENEPMVERSVETGRRLTPEDVGDGRHVMD